MPFFRYLHAQAHLLIHISDFGHQLCVSLHVSNGNMVVLNEGYRCLELLDSK